MDIGRDQRLEVCKKKTLDGSNVKKAAGKRHWSRSTSENRWSLHKNRNLVISADYFFGSRSLSRTAA